MGEMKDSRSFITMCTQLFCNEKELSGESWKTSNSIYRA